VLLRPDTFVNEDPLGDWGQPLTKDIDHASISIERQRMSTPSTGAMILSRMCLLSRADPNYMLTPITRPFS
jgi:hypothetical protein